jgi:release factor glutamine methyltransferase
VNIAQALAHTTERLLIAGVPDAPLDARQLVVFVTKRDKAFLVAHPEFELSADQANELDRLTQRRAAREPLQYVLGRQEFYGLEFQVSPAVLIPRPETEILVERAIEILKPIDRPTFCEIGTGSGCISVSVLHSLPNAFAIAGDVSAGAIEVAAANAGKHGVDTRLELRRSDVFSNIPEVGFHAILSNPPYVPETDVATLQAEVRDHEPYVALSGGVDGLDVIRRIVTGSVTRLRAGSALLFEMGFNQSRQVSEMLDPNEWRDIELIDDLQRIPRILFAVKR